MVKNIQKIEEYYDSYSNDDEDNDDVMSMFYAPSYYTTDEQLVLIACLMLLEQRYRLLQSMTLSKILDEIDDIMDSLESELKETAENKVESHVTSFLIGLLDEFAIPHTGYVAADTSMYPIISQSITTLTNQLHDEIKLKAMHFEDNMSKDDFNIIPNFQRAVQKLNDGVGNNLLFAKEKTRRNAYKFIYGEDKLYRWLTMNDSKVCNWCRIQEKLPPRTIDEMPLDHPHGRCTIDPIDSTYSDEYYILLAREEYYEGIETFR